jgi:hemerythrin-like domain-containing protein
MKRHRTLVPLPAGETVGHFRAEEELLFPTVVDFPDAREPLIQALLEHQRIRARAALLRDCLDDRRALAEVMRELGELLAAHVRHEERRPFPLIERLLDDRTLAAVELGRSDG